LNGIPRDRLPALVPVIGRIALGETEFSGDFESAAVMVLGYSRDRVAIPYLAAFLESPYNEKRVRAVVSLCELLRSMPGDKAQFRPSPQELYAHCPTGTPLRKPSTEPVYTTYWRAWYAAVKEPLLRELKLADVRTPSRFRDTSIVDEYEPEVPLETRFNIYIPIILRGVADSRNVPADAPPKPVFGGRMKPTDEQKLVAVVTDVEAQSAKLKQDLMQGYKATGVFPTQAAINRAEDSRRTLLKSALESLRRELTPEGYKLFESLLLEMGISLSPPTSLGPWD
jgi:hypothetical protein